MYQKLDVAFSLTNIDFSEFEVEKMFDQWKWIVYGKKREISKESQRLLLV